MGLLTRIMYGRNVSMKKERFKEQYSPVNIDVWIINLELE